MNLASGTRLGPYEIVAAIGTGGMGEVYRARDTRLNRAVAIKILSPRIASNPNLRERFERESKTISSLSHPHICALFDVGHVNGMHFLVMEFLDGETLAERLSRGPMPTDQVLRYGIESAEALDAAHRHGVVHRDLKPGNVVLTKSGAKLLDFGLARNVGGDDAGVGSTMQKPLTEEGTLLGTVQYMAPEQVEGKEADARTDIFALGATLYEMATGRRAFEGKTRASLIASILNREPPPVSQIQPASPPALERVIRICMAKEPDDRWQSAHDIAAELRWITEGTSSAERVGVVRGMPRRMVWGVTGLIAGLFIGAVGIWLTARDREPPAPVARFAIPLPPSAPYFFGKVGGLSISPDGSRFAYCAQNGRDTKLILRTLGSVTPVPINGTEGATTSAFSPDGHSIVFATARGEIKKISLDGGPPVTLASVTMNPFSELGLRWVNRNVYFVPSFVGGVSVIPDSGGTPRQILHVDPAHGARALVWPDVLPDGKTAIVTVWNNGNWDDAKIVAYPLGGGDPKALISGGFCARYVPSGHLIYARGGALFAVPFNASSLQVTGTPAPVVNGVSSGVINGEVHYAVSDNGTLVYASGGVVEPLGSLLWIDRHGNEKAVVPTKRPYGGPVLSPDGTTIAVTLLTATFDIWQIDIDRDTLSRVSFGGDDANAVWTADGRRIIWGSSRPGHGNLFWAPADNSSSESQLTHSNFDQIPSAVSPDGRLIAVSERQGERVHVALVPLAGDHTARTLIATNFNNFDLTFSPDGKWAVYISDESGHNEAYLRPFPGPGGRWQVSVDGADDCQWARSGIEIVCQRGSKFFAIPLQTRPQVRIGKPQLLFEKELVPGWQLSSDGKRILGVKSETPPTTNELQIVLNWLPELRRRAPAR